MLQHSAQGTEILRSWTLAKQTWIWMLVLFFAGCVNLGKWLKLLCTFENKLNPQWTLQGHWKCLVRSFLSNVWYILGASLTAIIVISNQHYTNYLLQSLQQCKDGPVILSIFMWGPRGLVRFPNSLQTTRSVSIQVLILTKADSSGL